MKIYTNYWDVVNYLDRIYEKKWWNFISRWWSLLENRVYYWDWLKYTVILEKYLDSNLSWFTIRKYIKLPKKYEDYFFNDFDEE